MAALDGNTQVLRQIAGAFAPHQNSPAAMNIQVDAGSLINAATGAVVSQPEQTSSTITAPVSYPRIDLAVVDAVTGALSIVPGSEAASPSAPACPVGSFPVAQIALAVGQTSIVNANLTDVRTFINCSSPTLPGIMQMYAGASAPTGWLVCDGSAVSRTTYAALFNVIGTTFGTGDGSTTFNLPDMRGRAPIGVGQGATHEGGGTGTNRVLGVKGGAETHTQAANELVAHTHSSGAADSPSAQPAGSGSSVCAVTGSVTGSTGSGAAMAIMDPFTVVNFIIKT